MLFYLTTVIVPRSRWIPYSAQSPVLLALWAASAGTAFALSLVDTGHSWSTLALMGSGLFLLFLWFSLQWDLTCHYVPEMPPGTWSEHSVTGFGLGVIAAALGFGFAAVITPIGISAGIISFDSYFWLMLLAGGAGLLLGFGILGWRQAHVLAPYDRGAWWWIGAMAVAWVPVVLAWLGYDALLRALIVNIYPEPHATVKVLTCETALLFPSLVVFALIVRRSYSNSMPEVPHLRRPVGRPLGVLAGLLIPPLLVFTCLGALLVGQSLRIERAWVAQGPAGYLSVDPGGNVATQPPAGETWDPTSKLWDRSPDGSMRAGVEEPNVVISTTAGVPVRSLQVFSVPPTDYPHTEDAVNVVRFSPDGKLLAASTGRSIEFDSDTLQSNDHAVHVWSVPDGTLRYALSEPRYSVRTLAWSPDGRYLAAAGGLENRNEQSLFYPDDVVRVWRLDTGSGQVNTKPSLALTFVGHTKAVEALAWSADSSKLVSRDLSGRVVIWRVP